MLYIQVDSITIVTNTYAKCFLGPQLSLFPSETLETDIKFQLLCH